MLKKLTMHAVAPQKLIDLGRERAYRRTLLNDAPAEAQYIETRKGGTAGGARLI